jgi:hypothetical protein
MITKDGGIERTIAATRLPINKAEVTNSIYNSSSNDFNNQRKQFGPNDSSTSGFS